MSRPSLQYATPAPPSRRRIAWLILIAGTVGVLIGVGALVVSSQRVTVVVTKPPPLPAAAAPKTVRAPTTPARITIIQRSSQPLPGTRRTITARIGDITGGQVLLSVDDINGMPLVNTTSMREGDRCSFVVGRSTFEIELAELRNFLVGDDFAVFAIRLEGTGLSEQEKIDRLIAAVAAAPAGVQFIRNGTPYDGQAAAEHLTRKYSAARDQRLTARQFIDQIASESTISGEPYVVRTGNGTQESSKQWLTTRLREIEAAFPSTQPTRPAD